METKRRRAQSGPRVQLIYNRLHQLAYERGPGGKLPTRRELCTLFSAGASTVDDALNQLESQNIVFCKQGSGIYVSPKIHQKSIAVAFGNLPYSRPSVSPFWGILQGLFIDEADKRSEDRNETYSFHVVPAANHSTHSTCRGTLTNMIRAGQVDLVLAVCVDVQSLFWIREQGVPVVSYAGPGDWTLTHDNTAFLRLALEQLTMQGCRRIALVDNIELDFVSEDNPQKISAIRRDLNQIYAERDQPFELMDLRARRVPDIEHFNQISSQDEGFQTAMEIFGAPEAVKPDGLIIPDDTVASGVLTALRKLGIRPGKDVKVATLANAGSPILYGWEDELIIMEIDPREIVKIMQKMMDSVLGGHPPDETMCWIPIRVRSRGMAA